MIQEFKTIGLLKHPGAKGQAGEAQWRDWFRRYLPERYRVAKAFVIDANGGHSDEIDVVIYDRQYSPLLFNQGGAKYVPAESVYAVFEAKPEISTATIQYAAEKAASVRVLHRTSAPIPHAGGVYRPKRPPRIMAGLLAVRSGWTSQYTGHIRRALGSLDRDARLDLACVLKGRSFDAQYGRGSLRLQLGKADSALVFFFLRLLKRLQAMGTVVAVEFERYEARV